MPKLLMLKGLPGSGKSTYARQLVEKNQYTRVNKDDLRAMLYNGAHSKSKEATVLNIRDAVILEALSKGSNVVVDDTNFAPIHEIRLRELAKEHGAQFEFKLIDTPLQTCIEQDLKRLNSVGQKVIMQMYEQWLKPKPAAKPRYDPTLPNAVICDIDGTLAHMINRGPYDTSKYVDDAKDDTVHRAFARIAEGDTRIICSGRSADHRESTEQWLATHGITYDLLLMRPEGDVRKDSIVKRELYETFVEGKYNVRLVLDDRNQVVDMWRDELGLTCFQVAPGDF
ncbi:AAA family ATPase [Rhodococcus qingshengii]|uniref:phosphatase domain-containing protein n=1 Tax=Rhodococcus qingshengii TaxID=334542 RepID=UPI0022084439|nr:AAA family ATPase [Rhodococcus qingshengii]BDQ20043.1 AAA family ATPase [Rhodococcus qingshengii]